LKDAAQARREEEDRIKRETDEKERIEKETAEAAQKEKQVRNFAFSSAGCFLPFNVLIC